MKEPRNHFVTNTNRIVKKNIKSLKRAKIKHLGIIEKIRMKYAGSYDGRNQLIKSQENKKWWSCTLNELTDAYEESCALLFGRLKMQEEEQFEKINILFDQIPPLKEKITEAKKRLGETSIEAMNNTSRKVGEENLTDLQVKKRRSSERSKNLVPLRKELAGYETTLSDIIDELFGRLSQIQERYDSTIKVADRLMQHTKRKIDIYWQSALQHMTNLPAIPDIAFNNESEQTFLIHYKDLVDKADMIRSEFETDIYKEVI